MDKTPKAMRTTNELMSHMPDSSMAQTLKRLGLWTDRAHSKVDERRPFKKSLSNLDSDTLSDEHSFWTSEAGRITELHGMLLAQKVRTDLETKMEVARARTSVRRENSQETDSDGKPVKKLTASEVADRAEENAAVMDAREQAVTVESMLASVGAAKEATLLYLSTISREITRRGDLMKGRLG